MMPGLDGVSDMLAAENRPEWNSQSKRLGRRDQVGKHLLIFGWRKFMKCIPTAGSPESALNLIANQKCAILSRNRRRRR
jgi:hypothetical protein